MRKILAFTLCAIFVLFTISVRAQVYVSPNGNDANDGSIDKPFKTISRALASVSAGDTVYLREGVYELSSTIKTNTNGSDSNYIKIWAYPGETPELDFSSQSYSSSSRGIQLSKKYWYLKGLKIHNAGDNGIHISGSHNIVEDCILYDNKDTGLQISNGGSYNLIINCDSYGNYDSGSHGENADGFAAKLEIGPGNEFRGCRAYDNSDDGWDCYESSEKIIFDSCWSFRNGYNIWGDSNFQGDGNGFKVGGNYIPGPHVLTRCIAFDNRGKGFDQNHNTAGVTLYNCTAYRNKGYNFSFYETPDTLTNDLRNNISYDGSVRIDDTALQINNSWQGFSVTSDDFTSLDTSAATNPRTPDWKLPEISFLRLSQGSSLIDAGIDVGLAYEGTAPDLGAFEYGTATAVKNYTFSKALAFELYQNYPNPFNPSTTISFSVQKESYISLKVYNAIGKEVAALIKGNKPAGEYHINFNAGNFSSGIYFYKLSAGSFTMIKKMILLK